MCGINLKKMKLHKRGSEKESLKCETQFDVICSEALINRTCSLLTYACHVVRLKISYSPSMAHVGFHCVCVSVYIIFMS